MTQSIYAYEFEDNLYINLTNKCPNRCSFCIRNVKDEVNGNYLWLKKKPSYDDVIDAINKFDLKKYNEVVFCGFGEPTCELDLLCRVGDFLKKHNKVVRLNTNGLANLINKQENVANKLVGIVDEVSISLNASDAEKYQNICKSIYLNAFGEMLKFAQQCVQAGIFTILSVVSTIGKEEIEKCAKIAENIGAKFRVREYIKEDDEY